MRFVVFLERKNTHVKLKMVDIREYFNEHVHVAISTVCTMYYISRFIIIILSLYSGFYSLVLLFYSFISLVF